MLSHLDWINKWAQYSPNKTAFREYESQRSVTYAELNNFSANLAGRLSEKYNIKTGDRIAVLAENSLEYIFLFGAAQKMGITLLLLNYRLTPKELDFLLDDSKPRMLIADSKFAEKLEQCEMAKSIELRLNMLDIMELAQTPPEKPYCAANYSFDENQPIFLIYTSGTTAFPKGAIYTHKMLFWNAINTELRLDITSNDKAINCAPPFHTGSWNVLQSTFLLHGAYTLLMRNFDPDAVLESMKNEAHTIFWGVPTMLKMMQESPKFQEADFSSIRYFVVGGEAMPIPAIKFWDAHGVPIRQGYGLTEVGPNVTSLNQEDVIRKQGSIGKPNFFYDMKLVDQNDREVSAGQVGECIIKAPTVTPGYWNNPEATQNAIKNGWFHTGDLMRCDQEGYYFIVDRIKNMYISGGENVYPAEVEHVLRNHKAVSEVAIVGVPDEKWGEAGKAFVVQKNNEYTDATELTNYCKENLAKYKVPKYFEFLDELPKNDAGKLDRKKLKLK